MNIFFVEDDEAIASGLIYALEAEGYNVVHCSDVKGALETFDNGSFSIALLDISLPDGNGFTIFQHIRLKSQTPIIFVTAADDENNTIKGLDMGADDYIAKPFRVGELIARIKAVMRRTKESEESQLILGNIKIDTSKAKVYKDHNEITLTALEYRLLVTFASNKGKLLTRNQILENLWDIAGNFVNDNTLTVYVKRLREKLEDNPQNPEIFITVRGLGYKAGE